MTSTAEWLNAYAEASGVSFEKLVETMLDAALQTEAPAKL